VGLVAAQTTRPHPPRRPLRTRLNP
jgi:hypothetical protein